ncbi:hypothetical protein [Sanguibacter sp. HDW7]|uniref:hypothetical protein n=1 Tax=Sanguibacter sp. HDW7 TaxID=2714931 RepID=UPI00140DA3ED|nr:hypothetical protein [Sanguibacter sp. HDW7]QIK83116.1 hypothetical protein G7063_05340 [Sanguibacter sp. HDW7]
MTFFRGLFVRKDATRGTSPVEARKSLAGLFLPAGAVGARAGVLSGLAVSGTGSWAYSVSAGYVVLSRSAADGAVLAGNDAAATVTTSPAPASGSRIDLVWVKHSDVDAGDPTSEIALGVTEGTAAASPVAPTLPTGVFELARVTVAAGATSTSHASVSIASTATRSGLRGSQVTAPTVASLDVLYPSAPDGLTAWATTENGVYVRLSGRWRRTVGYGEEPLTGSSPAFGIGSLRSAHTGPLVALRGVATIPTGQSYTLAAGVTGVALGKTPHPPSAQQIQRVTSQVGDLELVVALNGDCTLRNLNAPMSFTAGNYVSIDGVTYVPAT